MSCLFHINKKSKTVLILVFTFVFNLKGKGEPTNNMIQGL